MNLNPAGGIDPKTMRMNMSSYDLKMQRLENLTPALLVAVVLLFLILKTRRGIRRPETFIFASYVLFLIYMVEMMVGWVYFSNSVLGAFTVISIGTFFNTLTTFIVILATVHQAVKYCEHGHESFSINGVVGINNIAVNISNFVGTGIVKDYLTLSYFSTKSIIYVFTICIELAIIPMLFAFYFLKMNTSSSKAAEESLKKASRSTLPIETDVQTAHGNSVKLLHQ